MNILLDRLPDCVIVDDKKISIETDYRPSLRTIMAFEDNDLTMEEKFAVMSMNIYPTQKEISQAMLEQGMWFLNGGDNYRSDEIVIRTRTYSMAKDANLIFAAFQQTHRIDLQTAHLHWWKFLALFSDLGSDTAFCQLVGLRQRLADGTATDAERKMANNMQELVEIDPIDNSTISEKEAFDEFQHLIAEGQKNGSV